MALKYKIDGNLSDWGVDLSGDWSLNETWVPNDGVWFIVEDNRNPNAGGSYTGVHIKGVGSDYEFYDEPQVKTRDGDWIWEPYGTEYFDLEAIYVDEDDSYIYVAIVWGLDPNEDGDNAPGDIALNLDANDTTGKYGYEYGVKLGTKTGLTQWEIGYLPDWESPYYVPDNKPSVFKDYLTGGGKTGEAEGAYVQIAKDDHGFHNYVVEVAIPKDMVGMAGKYLSEPPFMKIVHVTDACGNDHGEVSIPEFLVVLVPVAIVLGLVFYLRNTKF